MVYISSSMLIPMQKTEKRKVTGMTKEAVKALMSVPDISTKVGLRDLTLLLVLYCNSSLIFPGSKRPWQ